jgi:hypothetical protein
MFKVEALRPARTALNTIADHPSTSATDEADCFAGIAGPGVSTYARRFQVGLSDRLRNQGNQRALSLLVIPGENNASPKPACMAGFRGVHLEVTGASNFGLRRKRWRRHR